MKKLMSLLCLVSIILFACAQKDYQVGKIYVIETQEIFFQFKENGKIDYYSINEIGNQSVSRHSGNYKLSNDTSMIMTINYGENLDKGIFNLKYIKAKDYWIDEDGIWVFLRTKEIKFKDFELKEN